MDTATPAPSIMATTPDVVMPAYIPLPDGPEGWMMWGLALLGGYLFGSIPFGLVLTRIFCGIDIRTIGSGNIGATNVLRTGNKPVALATVLLDAGKGAIGVWAFYALVHFGVIGSANNASLGLQLGGIAGLGAIFGHCYPAWLKFKGGKGVATAMGMLIFVPWWPIGIIAGLLWLANAAVFRISSLAGLVAMASTPTIALLLGESFMVYICTLLALLIFWRHRENIARLLRGEEPKIGAKKKAAAEAEAETAPDAEA